MQYVLSGKTTYQTSEDTWERVTLNKIVDDTFTMKDVFDWATQKKIDLNTITISPSNN